MGNRHVGRQTRADASAMAVSGSGGRQRCCPFSNAHPHLCSMTTSNPVSGSSTSHTPAVVLIVFLYNFLSAALFEAAGPSAARAALRVALRSALTPIFRDGACLSRCTTSSSQLNVTGLMSPRAGDAAPAPFESESVLLAFLSFFFSFLFSAFLTFLLMRSSVSSLGAGAGIAICEPGMVPPIVGPLTNMVYSPPTMVFFAFISNATGLAHGSQWPAATAPALVLENSRRLSSAPRTRLLFFSAFLAAFASAALKPRPPALPRICCRDSRSLCSEESAAACIYQREERETE
mmetsp:Transcript_20597/g.62827  ORF Transcript_20597/g.62827 Transcript_20597/m.62827 type:complete len:291 (-) Transcript_20597:109-981(-)